MDSHPNPADILFVDDDASMRDLASSAIERAHPTLEVTALDSPGSALEIIETRSVDCVVTDYSMPGMDGMAFLEAIRRVDPDLPVVFFTGKGNEEIASEAIAAGVTDYIQKEPGMRVFELLGARVDNLIRVRRAEKEAREADRRIKEAFDRVSDAIISLDEAGRVEYLNSGAESLFGPAEKLDGVRLIDAVPSLRDSDFEGLLVEAQTTQQSQSQEFELDMGDRTVSVTAYPGSNGISIFIQDLTPLKQREARIQSLTVELDSVESRFRALTTKLSRPVPPNR